MAPSLLPTELQEKSIILNVHSCHSEGNLSCTTSCAVCLEAAACTEETLAAHLWDLCCKSAKNKGKLEEKVLLGRVFCTGRI